MAETQPVESTEALRVISGFRPTSDLTLGNYLGGIKPVLEIQDDPGNDLYVFVADLHGLTDNDPRDLAPYRHEVVHDCLALGIDPQKTTVYLQSDIESEVTQIANRLAPYVTVSELVRTPNLKEKMRTAVRKGTAETDDGLTANFGLLGYPVLMAADIYAQAAPQIAVGEDQEPHLELARKIANRFNNRFGEGLLVTPRILAVEGIRVAALNGEEKMSKSNPKQAIMLTDDPDHARHKIKRATTANAGEWNKVIDSHFRVAESSTSNPELHVELKKIRAAHEAGQQVMGAFKQLWGDVTETLLVDFQANRTAITDEYVTQVLSDGAETARSNSSQVLANMRQAMGF